MTPSMLGEPFRRISINLATVSIGTDMKTSPSGRVYFRPCLCTHRCAPEDLGESRLRSHVAEGAHVLPQPRPRLQRQLTTILTLTIPMPMRILTPRATKILMPERTIRPTPSWAEEKFGGAEQQQLGGQRGDFLRVEREDEGCHEAPADGHTELTRMRRGHESRSIHLHVVSFCVPSVS